MPRDAQHGDRLARLPEVLDQVSAAFAGGQIDEVEAEQRLIDAGCTREGAEIHVARWKAVL
jgi:hypothetical protein